jgi:putative transposase
VVVVEPDTRLLSEAARAEVVEQLRRRRARGEPITRAVRQAVAALAVSERTIWRGLSAPAAQPSAVPALPTGWLERYLSWGGNVAAVWRELEAEGGAGGSLRAMQRRFAAGLTAAERAAARGGEKARRAYELCLRWEAEHRNAVWQADHKQLDVLVIAPGRRWPCSPWVTWYEDDYSRAVMGWAISLQRSSAEVLAAMRAAMLPDVDGRPLEGVPGRLRIDRGLEFAAGAVRTACLALGVEMSLARPYDPRGKGKVERFHRTLVDAFLAGLPHFTGGPPAADGELEAPGRPLLLAELVELFAAWVSAYNQRPHGGLDGRSPLEVFGEDPTPLRRLEAERARVLLLARRDARVHSDGIHLHRHRFTAPGLADLVGEIVQIAFAPHDDRSIEVFHRGQWRCTAVPQETLTPAQRAEVLAARRAHAQDLRRRQRAAARRARARIAPITAASRTITEVTELPADDRGRSTGLRLVAGEARADLLLAHERAREQ